MMTLDAHDPTQSLDRLTRAIRENTGLQDSAGRSLEDAARAALFGTQVGSAPREPAESARDMVFGRYVPLSRIGAGGMGVVVAAYDPELDRKVALKLLSPQANRSSQAGRTRLLREAQALAKLAHPNVVSIHDVGMHGEQVWIAMEFVAGETLSAWAKERRRTWREVLNVMTPAGRGLAAAHAAGLVHRDIKPDNIMVGSDGRVRVMDLGLAHALGGDETPAGPVSPDALTTEGQNLAVLAARVTQAGAVLGTPAYMSPEQFQGQPIDARADLFSFSVTLWEALTGERPFAGSTLIELAANVLSGAVRPVPADPHARRVPRWLRRVCLQGLAAQPERRFASMEALLDALSHGRARARVRKGLVGAAVAAVLGASAALYQRHDLADRIAACEETGAAIFDVWSEEARATVRESIIATGLSYAPVTADKVMPFLDAQAEAWREHRTRACLLADIEGTLDAEHLDRAVWCLDERRMDLAALLTELSRADETVVQNAVTAAAGLLPVSPCTDGQVLAGLPPPPADARAKAEEVRTMLSQARTLLAAGKYPEGLERTRAALTDAQALGWPPMTAATRRLEGTALEETGAYAEAEAASLAAYMAAAKVRAWDVAARAALDLSFNVGYNQARHAEGKVWAGHAEVAALFAGDPLGLGQADRLSNLAAIQEAMGAYTEAKELHERALAIREKVLGPEHPDVAYSLHNLALVHRDMGTYAEAKTLFERVRATWETALGPEHPHVAASLHNLALVHEDTGAFAEAKALHERALAILEKTLGPEHPDVAYSLHSLATVHADMGMYAEAKALSERALAIFEKTLGPEHPNLAAPLGNLAKVHYDTGAYAEAKALVERALAIEEKVLGPEHPNVASSLCNLANIHMATGAYAVSKALHERSLAIREKALGPEHPDVAGSLGDLGALALQQDQPATALPILERAVTIHDAHEGVQYGEFAAHSNLAEALVRTKGDRTRALVEAQKAADGFREAGDAKAKDLAEVEAFLAKHWMRASTSTRSE